MGPHVRFGGHFVQVRLYHLLPLQALTLHICQGHVDDTATLISKTPDGDSVRLLFQLNDATTTRESLLPYLIPKGYITIDGTSLTLTEVDDDKRTFGVMLIQHTQQKITLGRKVIGSKVNIEVDMVGKYVEKSVRATLSGRGGSTEWRGLIEKIVEDVLAKKGI
jgi:riboflavin synthase